jgi:hypothetical protein
VVKKLKWWLQTSQAETLCSCDIRAGPCACRGQHVTLLGTHYVYRDMVSNQIVVQIDQKYRGPYGPQLAIFRKQSITFFNFTGARPSPNIKKGQNGLISS